MMRLLRTSDWIREHINFQLGLSKPLTFDEIQQHVDARLNDPIALIRSRVAVGYIRYESNRGRSPCYLTWLDASIARYRQTGNLDALLDAAFYAIAEYQDPSLESTHYDAERLVRDER